VIRLSEGPRAYLTLSNVFAIASSSEWIILLFSVRGHPSTTSNGTQDLAQTPQSRQG